MVARLGHIQAELVRAALKEDPLLPVDRTALGRELAKSTVGLRRADLVSLVQRQALLAAGLLELLEEVKPGTTATVLDQVENTAENVLKDTAWH